MIESPRLLLRPLTTSDVEAFVSLHDDPRVSEFVGSYTHDQALRRLAAVEKQWAERGHGLCAVELKDTGEFIGRCGLNYWDEFDEVELGWTLRADHWGRGYATEAAGACKEWGFATLDVPYLTAMIRPGNTPSVRVAQRIGCTPLREDDLWGNAVTVYAAHRPLPTAGGTESG
ncbi:GNAT family N-acetyltransferase [Streptomyces sp. NPDC005953]|uniref:GNAT family N-acetyltransferase n=1 Tax=unclassified Streptomyces TaxID=2593676 RepID=UPI0033CB879E